MNVHYIALTGSWHEPIVSRVSDEFHNNWSTQLRKGLLELSILNALCGRRLYGYELVKRLSEIEGLVISEGTVYPILSRLRAEEYLKTSIEESPGGPPRKYYELTERGRAQLRRMNAHWTQLQDALERLRKERR